MGMQLDSVDVKKQASEEDLLILNQLPKRFRMWDPLAC